MPSTAGATIGIPPVDEADLLVRQLMQSTALDRSIPDGERFSQESILLLPTAAAESPCVLDMGMKAAFLSGRDGLGANTP